jgi:hypothetical protein
MSESQQHQIILRGESKGEMQDRLSDFFLDHYDDLHIINITFKDKEVTVLYEWRGVRR